MRYINTGWRAVYKRFTVFPLDAANTKAVEGFPGCNSSNAILTYGYIDRDEGLILEVLACGIKQGDLFRFYDTNQEIRSAIKMESLAEYEFYILDDPNKELATRYGAKIEELSGYDAGEEIEETRKMTFIDSSRDRFMIDDVTVYLLKKDIETCSVKVRINGLGDTYITGKLLEEPKGDFGIHKGDSAAFFVQQQNGGKMILAANLNLTKEYTEADLKDGKLLEKAIECFLDNRNEDTYIDVLEYLRDSNVWIPGEVSLKEGKMSVTPEIISAGNDAYMICFSSEEKMGEHGQKYAKVRKSFLECIDMAESLTDDSGMYDICGIAVNITDKRFVLKKDQFHILKMMKSNIKEDN